MTKKNLITVHSKTKANGFIKALILFTVYLLALITHIYMVGLCLGGIYTP